MTENVNDDLADVRSAVREYFTTLLTIDDVAELLSVKRSWVYDQVRYGRIPVRRLGGTRQVRFHPADLQAYIDGIWQPPIKDQQTTGPPLVVKGRPGRRKAF
jgi:excisionase family DNA binding protein